MDLLLDLDAAFGCGEGKECTRGGQSDCLIELQWRLSRISEFGGVRERMRDLVSDGDRRMKLVPRMEARLYELRAHDEHALQEQTNRRLNLLMNFEHIPITEIRYGYLIVMSMMVAVVDGQFLYFSRRGWFK
jgi:hypothetical protein